MLRAGLDTGCLYATATSKRGCGRRCASPRLSCHKARCNALVASLFGLVSFNAAAAHESYPQMLRLSIVFLPILAACSVPEPVAVRTGIPEYLLTCGEKPQVIKKITEGWVVALAAWGAGCYDHLKQVRELERAKAGVVQ